MIELSNIEFYNTPEGEVMVKPIGQAAYVLTENCREVICEMLAAIRERYPKAHDALMKLYSASSMNSPRPRGASRWFRPPLPKRLPARPSAWSGRARPTWS